MIQKTMILTIFILAGSLLSVTVGTAYADSQNSVPSTVEIVASTCGIEIQNGSPINYGSLDYGQTSAEETVNYLPTGNLNSDITIYGSTWDDAVQVVMPVGATHWSINNPGTSYASKNTLQSAPGSTLVNQPAGFSSRIDFQLRADLLDPQYAGPGVTQTITFVQVCV